MNATSRRKETRLHRGSAWPRLSTEQRQYVENVKAAYSLFDVAARIKRMRALECPRGIKISISTKRITVTNRGALAATIVLPQKTTKQTPIFPMEERSLLWQKVQARHGLIARIARKVPTTETTVRNFLEGKTRRSKHSQRIIMVTRQMLDEPIKEVSPTPPRQVWRTWTRISHIVDERWLTPKMIQAVEALAEEAMRQQLTQDELYKRAQEIDIPGYQLHRYRTGVAWMRGKMTSSVAVGIKIF